MSGGSWTALVDRLRAEEASADRPDTGLEAETVAAVRRKVEAAAAAVEAGDPARAVAPMREAAALVSDGWPYTSQLGAAVLSHKQALERARS